MNILVLGSGGREHALAWRMSQDPGVEKIYVMPGNPGMNSTQVQPLCCSMNLMETIEFCLTKQIDFVFIGPEKYLFEGWADQLSARHIPTVGPTHTAALLEQSKGYAKKFMNLNQIPTSRFFHTHSLEESLRALELTHEWRGHVIKLSGPALGKGVVVTHSVAEAQEVIQNFFTHSPPGIEDGLVIEETAEGSEISLFFACMGDHYQFMGSAKDHKRLRNGDHGPNTGGMGAIAPAPQLTQKLLEYVEISVLKPTLNGLMKNGTPYSGILFLGLMGNSLLEYNVRLGDPETQAILPLIEGNLALFFRALARKDVQTFQSVDIKLRQESSIHIVKAAKGYPGLFGEKVESGIPIVTSLINENIQQKWFFAGVKEDSGKLITSGGRVLGLTSWAKCPKQAQTQAYQALSSFQFEGEHYRTDIGGLT